MKAGRQGRVLFRYIVVALVITILNGAIEFEGVTDQLMTVLPALVLIVGLMKVFN